MKFIRQRYILFELITDPSFHLEKEALLHTIWKQVIKTFGEKVTFLAGLWMIRWDSTHNVGILRCDNVTVSEVISAMALISHINKVPVVFHTRKTSGTIKKTLHLWRTFFKLEPPKREE